jgi:hypothetical protein
MNKKIFFIFGILILFIGTIGLYTSNNLHECRVTENQRIILSSEVPITTIYSQVHIIKEQRKIMMREIEGDMNINDYFCFNNPQQQLAKRFSETQLPLK